MAAACGEDRAQAIEVLIQSGADYATGTTTTGTAAAPCRRCERDSRKTGGTAASATMAPMTCPYPYHAVASSKRLICSRDSEPHYLLDLAVNRSTSQYKLTLWV